MTIKERMTRKLDERGSALLVSLMVMVGLSLLGLGFVAISETESALSINERNYTQTLAVAEAGARVVVEWLQDPEWASERGLQPHNESLYPGLIDEIRTERTVELPGGSTYVGYYKGATPDMLFDRPFKDTPDDRFYGIETNPDILITEDNADHVEFLDAFNDKLFNVGATTPNEGGRVTEIAIYAPPIIGGSINGDDFIEGGVRYGLATIKVTATKFDTAATPAPIARRIVKMVLSEWPFPGPQGPIQSNANIDTGGNFGVHWGRMTSQGTMDIKMPLIGLPWFDAYQRLHFEHGYDNDAYTLNGGVFADSQKWLFEIVERDIEDPWYEARARGEITTAAIAANTKTGVFHPFKLDVATENIMDTPEAGYSNWWQIQDVSNPPDQKQVIFPRIDYEFWKEVAMQGSGTGNAFYLWPTGTPHNQYGDQYTDGVITRYFAQWTNVVNLGKPGFYFFDTKNRLNPQGTAAPGVLAENVEVNASADGNTFQMQGFIYLNAALFGTTGISGPAPGEDECIENGGPAACWYNVPGEPYRDVGYWDVDGAGAEIKTGKVNAGNGKWDYKDTNDNDTFDYFINTFTINRPSDMATDINNVPLPVAYFDGCTVGTDCSEPHEPYLNIKFPANAKAGGGAEPMPIGWYSTETRFPKDLTSGGAPVDCSVSANFGDCTSNGYDRDGRLVGDIDPVLDGVMYIEGEFDTEGLASYFGSLLVNGDVIGTGTPEVWFDEKLVKGDWPPVTMRIPRVYVTAHQTDQ